MLTQFIDKFKDIRVLVVGDVMLDVFLRVRDQHLTDPSDNFPILREESRLELVGGAANAAMNLRAMGATVHLVGLVGKDGAGDTITQLLGHTTHRMSHELVTGWSDRITTVKTRISGVHFHDDVNLGIRIDSQRSHLPAGAEGKELADNVDSCAMWAHGVLLSDYGHGTICRAVTDRVQALYQENPDLGVHLDPHRAYPPTMPGHVLHCMTPNTEEALLLWRKHRRGLTDLGGPDCTVVVTGGENGARIHRQGEDFDGTHVPVEPVHHPRVCGAGDSFAAALLLSRLAGADWVEAVTLANAAGRAAVQQPFTAVVSADQLVGQLSA